MGLRRSRVKILVVVAALITLYALYQRLSMARKDSPLRLTDTDQKHHGDEQLELPPRDVEIPPNNDNSDSDSEVSYTDVEDMKEYVLSQNFKQEFHNENKFGPHTKESEILVVQVHDRADFFRELLNSLKLVRGIEKATLVFSMDKLVKGNEDAIKQVDFCRYLKIYFPYSKQLYPKSFPGEDPNDCPRDTPKAAALAKKCNNAEYPDQYGHYREVNFVQTKHHWIWKLHMAFSGIRAFAGASHVLLLEEDYYVAPDILHCMKEALKLKDEKCDKCQTISLGNYEPSSDANHANHIEIKGWLSNSHNMGMVITRQFYKQIDDCSEAFCDYDDYNWDWSLQAASSTCMSANMFTMLFKVSRIAHIGSCGMHSKGKNCDAKQEAKTAQDKFNALTKTLFPEKLHVALDSAAAVPKPRPNGGWGDIRDHTLCKEYKNLCSSAVEL